MLPLYFFCQRMKNSGINDALLVRSFDELRDQSLEALKRLNPAFVFYESGVDKRHVTVGWFEFKSYGLDTDVYNLMFVSRIGGKMLHGIFNCDYEDVLEWREPAQIYLDRIKQLQAERRRLKKRITYRARRRR